MKSVMYLKIRDRILRMDTLKNTTINKQGELLRQLEEHAEFCIFCHRSLPHKRLIKEEHRIDCEWAKVLE